MSRTNGLNILGRAVLALLVIYALAMIVPDFLRVVRPLGSFGLATNADGLIYDVQGPFATEDASPAARAGLHVGDRLDLRAMRCIPANTELCASNAALWAGVNYVLPGRTATLILESRGGQPAREVRFAADSPPRSVAADIVLALSQISGALVVLGAAWLVWTRPGPMTWGFFAYVMFFNPGLTAEFYARLQQWPPALIAQHVASGAMQAAGYTGLLLFALRAPVDRTEGRWRLVERALPGLAVLFLAVELSSLGSLFGFRTEFALRATVLLGFAVSAGAIAILIARRSDLSPRNYQRIRWVLWGCLIGLPANLIGELWQETSLLHSLFGGALSENIAGIFYLINGILCLFVVEAVRRPTVVSVGVPLRRATVLGLLLSLPAFLIHEQLDTVHEWADLPEWAWLLVASALVFFIARLHEQATERVDWLLDRNFRMAERRLEHAGRELLRADSLAEIERLLVEEPVKALKLASAALFRREGDRYVRRSGVGWGPSDLEALTDCEPPLPAAPPAGPFPVAAACRGLPDDLARPVLGAPVGNARSRFAVVLYSGHEAGTDLDAPERELLAGLARDAAIAYGQVEREILQRRVERLESLLREATGRG